MKVSCSWSSSLHWWKKTFRVSGKGVETAKGTGDLLVTVEVVVPDHLTDDQRRLVEQLRDTESGEDPRSHLGVT